MEPNSSVRECSSTIFINIFLLGNISLIIYIKINYTLIKGRQTTSCAANPFCIINFNLWKITFLYLGDIILLCMTFCTLFKRLTAFGAEKPKVSNTNNIKICWLSETHVWPFFKCKLNDTHIFFNS
jgi:hypothetical protein